MKSLIALALGASALTSALPVAAQVYPPRVVPGAAAVQPGHDLREQVDALDRRVQEGIRSGQMDREESDRASRELGSIRGEMERLRAQGGGRLSEIDRGRLQERIDGLSRSIRWMRGHGAGPGGPVVGDWSLERREGWLQERIDRGRADGSLSRREAYRAQTGLNNIKADHARMMRRSYGRLRESDRAILQDRLDRLSAAMRWARQNDETAPPWRR